MTSTNSLMPHSQRKFLATAMAAALLLAPSGDRQRADGQEPHRLKLTQSVRHRFPTDRLPAGISLGPVIPGLSEGGIPQGLCYVPGQEHLRVLAVDLPQVSRSGIEALRVARSDLNIRIEGDMRNRLGPV